MNVNYKFTPVLITKIQRASHKFKKGVWQKHKTHHHAKGTFEIIFIDYGVTTLVINKHLHHLEAGQCIIIPGDIEHNFRPDHAVPLNFVNIMFSGELPEIIQNRPIMVSSLGHEIARRFTKEIASQQEYSNELAYCLLTDFIVLLIRQLSAPKLKSVPSLATHLRQGQSPAVKRAIAIIAEQYAKPLQVAQVARAAGVGSSHLRKLLRQETGSSFLTLLHEQRITIAKHLLRGPDNFTMQEIADTVGYSSSSFFFKIFKRIVGMTPKNYACGMGEEHS